MQKKWVKKTVATVLTLCLLASVMPYAAAEDGFVVSFATDEHFSITTYTTSIYTDGGTLDQTSAIARDSATGAIDISGNGQVNFTIVPADGYEVAGVSVLPTSNYKNLKGPADTALDNTYRITKITADVTVTVTMQETGGGVSEDGFVASFITDGHCSVTTYTTSDYTVGGMTEQTSAIARNSDTGAIDITGEGQVNFTVVPADGYEVASVSALPISNYNNLKGPADTALANTYRLTQIIGDITVTVTTQETGGGVTEEGFVASFITDGYCTITTYTTSNYTLDSATEQTSAIARNSDTGIVDITGDGQVNFTVVPVDGYEIANVSALPISNYNNLKGPDDTGLANTYRITKITDDVTVTVTMQEIGGGEVESPVITFANDAAVLTSGDPAGVIIDGTAVIISAAGQYIFTGSCTNGSIDVSSNSGAVNLVLNNLNLTSTTTAPIDVNGPGSSNPTVVTITSTDGAVNTLNDTDRAEASPKSVINLSGDTVFEGTGKLTVNGYNKNGIKSDQSIAFGETELVINSVDNGLSADNVLTINSGIVRVTSTNGDALKAYPDVQEDDLIGKIVINGGTLNLASPASDGIQTLDQVCVNGGNITIVALQDAINALADVVITDGSFNITAGFDGIQSDADVTISGGSFTIVTGGGYDDSITGGYSDTESYKGIKAGTSETVGNILTVSAGTININSLDDSLNSNGYIFLLGGNLNLSASDDAVHADIRLDIGVDGGDNAALNIYVVSCNEGLEGGAVRIYSGTISMPNVYDDGINSAGGSDGTEGDDVFVDPTDPGTGGPPGGGPPGGGPPGGGVVVTDVYSHIYIYGGEIFIDSEYGDGIDANGSIYMYGGNVVSFGPPSSNNPDHNEAFDYETEAEVHGGTLLAIGASTPMQQVPTADSTQPYLIFITSSGFSALNTIAFKTTNTAAAAAVYSYVSSINKTVDHVVFSSPDLMANTTYYLYAGTTSKLSAKSSTPATTIAITASNFTVDTLSTTYTGYKIYNTLTTTLKENSEYLLTYTNNINVGTATITIQGAGKYTGTVTKTFAITAKPLTIAQATVSDKVYDGTTAAEVTSVLFGDAVLTPGTDYTASAVLTNADAGDNKAVTVTVTLLNTNYTLAVNTFTAAMTVGKASGSEIAEPVQGSYTGNGTDFTYTIDAISGAEYSDGSVWQDSNVFDSILPNATMTFYARLKATINYEAGTAKNTGAITFSLLDNTALPELNYSVAIVEDEAVLTIAELAGAEYSFDSGVTWDTINSAAFTKGTIVDFGIRYAATATHNASPSAAGQTEAAVVFLADLTATVIDSANGFICGIAPGTGSVAGLINPRDGYEISCVETENGFGTGTVVNIQKDGVTVDSYMIVIYGDFTGDGNVDSIDAGVAVDFENYRTALNPSIVNAFREAGDLNGDGNIDCIDAGIMVDYENYLANIEQSTGNTY